jgi:adenosylcobinamide kinase / adenosylcobinamide-phosphate guanylyltransferase
MIMGRENMGQIIYISGGCRSGKSGYAQQLAESLVGSRGYVATCPVIDPEMDERIARHQQDREGRGWQTIEAPLKLAEAIRAASKYDVLLVDCLTLWVNNLLYEAEQQNRDLSEDEMHDLCGELISACREQGKTIIFVSNELGMGLVPADSVSRRYRDLIGRCNQAVANAADDAVFMVSGLPLKLKQSNHD